MKKAILRCSQLLTGHDHGNEALGMALMTSNAAQIGKRAPEEAEAVNNPMRLDGRVRVLTKELVYRFVAFS
jgi:hypothetical protein